MDLKRILWYAMLTSISGAYFVGLAGVRSAKVHDVPHHARRMIIACTVVGIWPDSYVLKLALFGREPFCRTSQQYWTVYLSDFASHMLFALTTIALGAIQPLHGLALRALWPCRRHGGRDDHASKIRASPSLDILRHDRDRLSRLHEDNRLVQGITG